MISRIKRILHLGGTEVPVVRLAGIIASREQSLNLDRVAPILDRGFALAKKTKTILVLAIESPGGSPVQSDLIAQYIRRKVAEDSVKVAAVIGDVGASGGYWIACAADEIYANPMSIVGSVGVIGGGFGLHELLNRFGIERRVTTAGTNKLRNDPFAPARPEDVAFNRELVNDIHSQFMSWVRCRRGTTIEGHERQIFDGSYMLGTQAKEYGLIDDFSDVRTLIQKKYGKNAKPLFLAPKKSSGLVRFIMRGVATETINVLEREFQMARVR